MDGKVMGFRSDLALWQEQETCPAEQAPEINVAALAYIRRSRDGFGAKVRAYATGKAHNGPDLKRMAKKHAPELEWMLQMETCPVEYRRFLRAVATEYPITTLIPRDAVDDLARLIEMPSLSMNDRLILYYKFPALFDLVTKCGWTCIAGEAKSLLRRLVDLARIPFLCDPISSGHPENPMAFFPNNPLCRPLRRPAKTNDPELKNICTKHTKRTINVTPGMFALFCPHGICLGFEAMKNFEGPMTAYNIIYRRFKIPPGILVYDNCCNLSRTCLKLSAAHFALTLFLIDRVHQPGHVGCHEGYNMNAFPKDTPVLGGEMTLGIVNSQVCEQCNSKLEMIATQTKFMGQKVYMAYTKLFLYLCNKELLKQMTPIA